jgi:predicted Zn finger-like uncharacterized protein
MHIKVQCSSCGSRFRAEDRLIGKRVKCPKCGNIFNAQDSGSAAYDAFISYASQDASTANLVCSGLEKEGLRCWIAPRDILPGAEYGASIVAAIHRSRSLVLVFSSHANHSPQVRREVERAASKDLPIVPLRIENVTPSEAMEFFISSRHWSDALNPPLEPHIRLLAERLCQMLSIPTRGPTVSAEDSLPERKPAGTSSRGPAQDVVNSEASMPRCEQGHRLAYTLGYAGLYLINCRGSLFANVSPDAVERAYWPAFEYACTQLRIKSELRDYLQRVGRLAEHEIAVAVSQHITGPLSALTVRDRRYNGFALLGAYFGMLDVYLQCEAMGVPNAKLGCMQLFVQLTGSAYEAQLPLETINLLHVLQDTHMRLADPVDARRLAHGLRDILNPLYVVPPATASASAD